MRSALAEAFDDWIDDPQRNLVWNHHMDMAIMHQTDCPDDECCNPLCPGAQPTCCCDHGVETVVAVNFQMFDLRPGAPETMHPVSSSMVLPLGYFATRHLILTLMEVREAMEQRADENALIGSLGDVEAEIRQIIEDGE